MSRLLQLSLFIVLLPGQITGQSSTAIEKKTENSAADVSTFSSPTLGKQHFEHPDHFIRCLTPIIEEYENNPESRSALGPILGVESIEELHQKHTSAAEIANYEEYLSESGRFLIRFKRTGTGAVSDVDADENGIPDYVDHAAVYADSSWNYLVGELGFNDPIPILDNPLIIRIDSLSRGVYGSYSHGTEPNLIRTINVQNKYPESDFPPNLDPDGHEPGALKVTIAHELKHAIQYVTFVSRSDVRGGWIELDATMAEEVVYPTVKDYLNYLTSNQNPSISLNPQRTVAGNPFGYYHVTAGLFYREKFGDDFWVKTWDRIASGEATGSADYMHKAISLELASRGYSPDMEFVNLYLWHYAAGTRSTEEFGFKDRLLYPDIRLSNTDLNRFLPFKSPYITLNSKAAYVYEFYPDATLTSGENVMVGIFRSPKLQSFDGRIHVGLIAYYKNGTIDIANIDLNEDTELTSFYGSPMGFIGGNVDWNLDEIEKIGVIVANTTPQTQSQTNPSLPRAQLVIGTTSTPSPNKFGKIIPDALEEAQAEALLDRLVGKSGAPSINTPIDFITADVSGNETLSAYDASLILQKNDSKITGYPSDPKNLIFVPLPTWYTDITPPLASIQAENHCTIDCFSSAETTDVPEITFQSEFGDPSDPENLMDDTLRVRISVDTPLSFHSGFFEVDFDSTLLNFVNYELSSSTQDMIKTIHHDTLGSGYLKLALAASEEILDSESVVTLNFRPKPIVGELTDVDLTLTKLELDEQFSLSPNISTTSKVKSNEPVSIERPTEIPISTTLHPAYPNPFNPTTTIPFSISERRTVSIQIFDITGRHISTVSNDIFPPGLHTVRFDAVNLSSGMYIARMVVTDPNGFRPAEMFIQRLTLIK